MLIVLKVCLQIFLWSLLTSIGVTHEGEAVGKYEEINGVKTYVALPSGEYDKTKAILFLSDIYGHQLINSRLLADDFARNGFQVRLRHWQTGLVLTAMYRLTSLIISTTIPFPPMV